jgi:hypothetical protein
MPDHDGTETRRLDLEGISASIWVLFDQADLLWFNALVEALRERWPKPVTISRDFVSPRREQSDVVIAIVNSRFLASSVGKESLESIAQAQTVIWFATEDCNWQDTVLAEYPPYFPRDFERLSTAKRHHAISQIVGDILTAIPRIAGPLTKPNEAPERPSLPAGTGDFTRIFGQNPPITPKEVPEPPPSEFTRMLSGPPTKPNKAGERPSSPAGPGDFTKFIQKSPAKPQEAPKPGVGVAPGQRPPSPPAKTVEFTGVFGQNPPIGVSAPRGGESGKLAAPKAARTPWVGSIRTWFGRVATLWRIQRSAGFPEGRTVDNVNLSLTAPSMLSPGKGYEVRFWAHLESQTQTVVDRALHAMALLDPRKMFLKTEGPFEIPRGTAPMLTLSMDELVIIDSCKHVIWTGDIGCATFLLTVPNQCRSGPKAATASVRVHGSEIAKIDFVLNVGKGKSKERSVPANIRRYRTAFASYANQDRDAVLARIQGIQKAVPSMEIFVELMSLRSGEDWEQRLFETIRRADVFYLFWCRHARDSEWVQREWRCAYQAKGLGFIDPVPLESPATAPPPPELCQKHFDDPILTYIQDKGHE